MRYTDLPQSIQDISDRLDEINMRYVGYVGWLSGNHYQDMAHGDKIRIGKLNAALWRAIADNGLRDQDVLFAIAQKGSK